MREFKETAGAAIPELAHLADLTGLDITVCHLPPGTSKWSKIEQRLFSHISMNWRGRPVESHKVIINTLAATTTRSGLTVHAELDTRCRDCRSRRIVHRARAIRGPRAGWRR